MSGQMPTIFGGQMPTMLGQLSRNEAIRAAYRMFAEQPLQPMRLMQSEWALRAGSLINDSTDLSRMLTGLSLHFIDDFESIVGAYEEGPFPRYPSSSIWKACLELEFPVLLQDMIKDELFFDQSFNWIQTVLALNAGITKVWIAHAHPEAMQPDTRTWPSFPNTLVDNYFQGLDQVCEVLWSRRDVLLSESSTSKPGRVLILVLFAHAVIELYRMLYPERLNELVKMSSILGVGLAAWTRAASLPNYDAQLYGDQHSLAFLAISNFRLGVLESEASEVADGRFAPFWRSTIDTLVQGIGRLKFMRACFEALNTCTAMVGSNLMICLEVLGYLLVFHRGDNGTQPDLDLTSPTRRAFWDVPMHFAIANALERECFAFPEEYAPLKTPVDYPNMSKDSCALLIITQRGLTRVGEHPPSADGGSVFRIMSRCLYMLSKALEDRNHEYFDLTVVAVETFNVMCLDWEKLFTPLYSTNTVQNNALRRVTRDIKQKAEGRWYTDLHLLRTLRGRLGGDEHYNLLLQSWILFGKALGLEETTERDRHDAPARQLCSWTACKFYYEPSPSPLSKCSGCHEQKYCSRECQTKDWKEGGHRKKCRRLKA